MKAHPSELLQVARRVVWFKPPQETLQDARFFLTHVMIYGTLEDVLIARRYYAHHDFEQALDSPLPGVFDPRSWAYWNVSFGHIPVPALPKRLIR